MNAGTFLALLALGYYLLWRGSQPGRALPPAAVPPPPQLTPAPGEGFIPTDLPPPGEGFIPTDLPPPGKGFIPTDLPPPGEGFIPTDLPPPDALSIPSDLPPTGTVISVLSSRPVPQPAFLPAPSTVSLRTPEMAAALWTRRKVIEAPPPGNVDERGYEHWLRNRYFLQIGALYIEVGPTREGVQSLQARIRFINRYLTGLLSDRHLAAQV